MTPFREGRKPSERKNTKRDMAGMTRKEAREEVFRLLFETDFRPEETPEEVLNRAKDCREFDVNKFIREEYFGVREHKDEIDAMIVKYANGWKLDRITPASRSVLRLCIYEMMFRTDIPKAVSLNEAVDLVKKFDDAKARPFVNGILNSVKNEIEAKDPQAAKGEEKKTAPQEGNEG